MNILPVKLPDIGEGVTEAELVEWHVELDGLVREDDVIAAVMTDKATVEIPSPYTGKIIKLGGDIGQVIAVGADLVLIETDAVGNVDSQQSHSVVADLDDEEPDPHSLPTATVSPDKKAVLQSAEAVTVQPAANFNGAPAFVQMAAPRPEGQVPLASPSVRARAKEGGIDLRQVAGTGPAGRVTHSDLDLVFATPSSGGTHSTRRPRTGVEEIKVIGLRRKIAERMALANARIPHITVVEEVDVTELEDLRGKLNSDRGEKPKLTLLPFIMAALAKALHEHPQMNAHFDDDAGLIRQFEGVHTGIATMTDSGLTVPVLRHAEAKGLFETAMEIMRLSEAVRSGKASRDELSGSTITITSLGPLGAIVTTPIINHPEVAIVGINKMAMRPMWDGTQFVPRKMMNISASFDHRVIDGWDAAVFVQRIKGLLETPGLIFIED